MHIALITVSDKLYKKGSEEPLAMKLRQTILLTYPACISYNAVRNERADIKTEILKHVDEKVDVIFTIGGTGFDPRDVTPEVTKEIIEKEAPGLAYAMISQTLQITQMAMLMRLVCGIAKESLIINLPDSSKIMCACFLIISEQLHTASKLIKNKNTKQVNVEHKEEKIQNNFNIPTEKYVEKSISKENESVGQSSAKSKVKILPAALRSSDSSNPISVEDANEIIRVNTIPASEIETIPIDKAIGRVLAADVISPIAVPSVPTSSVNGYAVYVTENNDVPKRTVKNIADGDSPYSVTVKGIEAVRVSRGAAIPQGANAVVPLGNTTVLKTGPDGLEELEIIMSTIPKVGENTRLPAADIALNSKVVQKENLVTAFRIGLLASIRKTHIKVYRLPSIGIISTGNELQSNKNQLEPGQIYDSNKPTIMHLLKENGFESDDCGIVGDSPNAIKSALEAAFEQHDLVITTGGLSMGDFDLIKEVILKDFEDGSIHFDRVNIKPGRHTTFATLIYKDKLKTVFCLSGNAVSAALMLNVFCMRHLNQIAHIPPKFLNTVLVETKIINEDTVRPLYVGVKKYQKVNSHTVYVKLVGQNLVSTRLYDISNMDSILIIPPNGYVAPGYTASCLEI